MTMTMMLLLWRFLFFLFGGSTSTTHAFVVVESPATTTTTTSRIRSSQTKKRIHVSPTALLYQEDDHDKHTDNIRPLTQNWWPVITMDALDPTRPNPIELLEQKLVLRNSDSQSSSSSSSSWSCVDDVCPHRCAPLSEGRVVPAFEKNSNDDNVDDDNNNKKKNCLQCAYHGWEFNQQGNCHRIPQLEEQRGDGDNHPPKAPPPPRIRIQTYPLRFAAGMVWVWADPATRTTLAEDIPLPLSSLLQRYDQHMNRHNNNNPLQHGGNQTTTAATTIPITSVTYMRDLPYGMELLGENLVDISHLPFSHHKVGGLRRQDGRPVPLKMLSQSQRQTIAQQMVQLYHDPNHNNPSTSLTQALVVPTYQATVLDAARHDPELVSAFHQNPFLQQYAQKEAAVSHVGFFAPHHVRYHRNPGVLSEQGGRAYEIQLFMCPTTAGKSRVFLMAPFEQRLPPLSEMATEDKVKTTTTNATSPTATTTTNNPRTKLKSLLRRANLRKKGGRVAVPPYFSHMIVHDIFDGDGIFLHMQGDRMLRSNATFRNYQTPTSSDAMVNLYRRWLKRATDASLEHGQLLAAAAVSGNYGDTTSRAEMLDRYHSHTQFCPLCRTSLQQLEQEQSRKKVMATAFTGAAGALGVGFVSSLTIGFASSLWMILFQKVWHGMATGMLRMSLSMGVGAVASLAILGQIQKRLGWLETEIRKFYFEDYVHAEIDD